MTALPPALIVRELSKTFTLHIQGTTLPVLRDLDLTIAPGAAVVLSGPSGAGKSSLMRCVSANYRPQTGTVLVPHDGRIADLLTPDPREALPPGTASRRARACQSVSTPAAAPPLP